MTNKTLRIQIGNMCPKLTRSLANSMRHTAKKKQCELCIEWSPLGEELAEKVQNDGAKIYVLIVNSIVFETPSDSSPSAHLENTLQLITNTKVLNNRPVIAMAAPNVVEDYPLVTAKIKKTADFFFELPLPLADFEMAFRTCLDYAVQSQQQL